MVGGLMAENPIIRDYRAADPSAHVWGDGQVWIYTSQDHGDSFDTMDGYLAFSSSDMKTWKSHGEVLHSRDLSWGVPGYMWAPTAAFRNEKYYLIFPHSMKKNRNMSCGVAVADSPAGPFRELGIIPGVEGQWLDPCVFQDDDGEYYLYWGVQKPMVAKLKSNMLELAEEPRPVVYGAGNFFEASYVHKKDGRYYFSYNTQASGGHYSVGESPYGPFKYHGVLLQGVPQFHGSVVEFGNQNSLFYHIQNWNGGSKTRRNVCVTPFDYNSDGTIRIIDATEKCLHKAQSKPSTDKDTLQLSESSDI